MALFTTSLIRTDDVRRVQEGLRAMLRAKYPTLSLGPGTAIDDILVGATSYLAAAFLAEAEEVRSRLSLSQLSSRADTEGVRAMEDLASNWLVYPTTGTGARGIIYLEFSEPVSTTVPSSILFTRGEGVIVALYDTTADLRITESNLIQGYAADGTTLVYRYPLYVVSVGASPEITLSPGTFNTTTIFPSITSIVSKNSFLPGIPDGNTEDLISRAQSSVTRRGFSTYFSAKKTMEEAQLPGVLRVTPIGAGDPEMFRDLNRAISDPPVHTLGKANLVLSIERSSAVIPYEDFKLSSGAYSFVEQVLSDTALRSIVSFFPNDDNTYSKVTRVGTGFGVGDIALDTEYPNTNLLAGEVTLSPSEDTTGSIWDSVYSVGAITSDRPRLEITKFLTDSEPTSVVVAETPQVALAQAVIDSDSNRALTNDVKAQSATLVGVKPSTIRLVRATNVALSDISSSLAISALETLVSNWDNSTPLGIQDMITAISLQYTSFLTSVYFVAGVEYVIHLPDGRDLPCNTYTSIDIEDSTQQRVASPLTTSSLLSMQVSNRTSSLYIHTDDITVEVI